ncbi:hypothetical protein BJX66DRAFT_312291 [Aspergillus keveii]|uniref:Uncharacterized protein n=1 Tax=Aspergillus keveii TaxID=714993 RepID=A0ABR4FU04_9EURO
MRRKFESQFLLEVSFCSPLPSLPHHTTCCSSKLSCSIHAKMIMFQPPPSACRMCYRPEAELTPLIPPDDEFAISLLEKFQLLNFDVSSQSNLIPLCKICGPRFVSRDKTQYTLYPHDLDYFIAHKLRDTLRRKRTGDRKRRIPTAAQNERDAGGYTQWRRQLNMALIVT